MKLSKKKMVLCFLASLHLQAFAGSLDGPFIIWVNLSQNKQIDRLVEEQLANGEDCSEPRIVVTAPPEWIGNDLVSRAFLKQDKKAILALDRLMRKPVKGQASEGFDGIMVYDEVKGPRISSLTRSWKEVLREKVARPAGKAELWKAFCISIPEVTRSI
jgi:hypothetical protein